MVVIQRRMKTMTTLDNDDNYVCGTCTNIYFTNNTDSVFRLYPKKILNRVGCQRSEEKKIKNT